MMSKTYFMATEGSVMKNPRQIRLAEAHIGMGDQYLREGNYEDALKHYFMAMDYPDNLHEEEPEYPVYTRIYYRIALAYEASGSRRQAKGYFEKAAEGLTRPDSEATYYRALAYNKLGKTGEAERIIGELEAATASPGSQQEDVRLYLESLVLEFRGEKERADQLRSRALRMNPNVDMQIRVHGGSMDPRI
jgi:tetratricopeptide (TPR) repeat protein